MSEIWCADWTFYHDGLPVVSSAVVTKKLPLLILLATTDAYDRALLALETRLGSKFIGRLDKGNNGLKKFKMEYVRKIGM